MALGVMVVLGAGGAGAAWYASRMSTEAPAWWAEVEATLPAEQAREFENAALTQLSAVRPEGGAAGERYRSGEWSVSISEADANAWLEHRLRGWAESQELEWPGAVSKVRVRFEEGVVVIAARVLRDGRDVVVSARARVRFEESGALWVEVEGLRLGRLPVPAGLIREEIDEEEVREMIAGRRPVMDEALIPVDSGRRVRLIGLRSRDGRLEVTARTEGRP